MNKVNEIMGVLNKIDYGFIDNDGINIFDDNLNVEYKFNNTRVSNDESFGKNYMQGKYGAIPYIDQHFSKFFDNLKEAGDE